MEEEGHLLIVTSAGPAGDTDDADLLGELKR